MQQSYAAALHGKQLVPTVVIGNTNGKAGSNTSATALIDLLTAKTAKELAIDLGMNKTPAK